MKRLRKLADKPSELSEDIIINILHRLPSKSLAKFKCVSKCWHKYIADSTLDYSCRSQRWRPQPDLIGFFYRAREASKLSKNRFFFSSKDCSSLVTNTDGASLDESVNFLGKKVYIVASSNGFLLCNESKKNPRVYYVYNPACTRQRLALPKTQLHMEQPAVGFSCKIDDHPDNDVVSFTIVRYAIPRRWIEEQVAVTIESFSSKTNVWTANKLILDVPLTLYPFTHMKSSSSAGVIDGVFCWLDNSGQITVYDSVFKSFWALESPEEMFGHDCFLGLSGGAFYFAANYEGEDITVWKLESNIRSRDAVWIRKYDANVAATVQQSPEAFGLAGDTLRVEAFGRTGSLCIEVQSMVIHPALPHIFYLDVRGKVISYDLETDTAQLVYDLGEPWWRTERYKFFAYEWHQWPRLL